MAETWYSIVDGSGECRGHTSIQPPAGSLPPSWSVLTHANRMDQTNVWNKTSRTWQPRPAPLMVDRLQDLADHPYVADVWQRLTAAQRVKLRKLLVWLLAGRRMREHLEETSVDPPKGWPSDPSLVDPGV